MNSDNHRPNQITLYNNLPCLLKIFIIIEQLLNQNIYRKFRLLFHRIHKTLFDYLIGHFITGRNNINSDCFPDKLLCGVNKTFWLSASKTACRPCCIREFFKVGSHDLNHTPSILHGKIILCRCFKMLCELCENPLRSKRLLVFSIDNLICFHIRRPGTIVLNHKTEF